MYFRYKLNNQHWIDLNRLEDQIYFENDRFKSIIIENRSILNQNRDRHFGFQRFNRIDVIRRSKSTALESESLSI